MAGSRCCGRCRRCFLAGASAAAGVALINSIGNLGGYIGPFAVGAIKEQSGRLNDGLYFLAASLP